MPEAKKFEFKELVSSKKPSTKRARRLREKAYTVTIEFSDGSYSECVNLAEAESEILHALSQGVLVEDVSDSDGAEYSCLFAVRLQKERQC